MIASRLLVTSHPSIPPRQRVLTAASATLICGLGAAVVIASGGPARAASPPDVGLGTAAQFSVLASDGITKTGAITVTGDVGSAPTTSVSGTGVITPPGAVRGAGDLVVTGAKADLLTAFGQAAGAQPSSTTLSAADIGGQTLVGGTYTRAGSLGLTGTLTLDGENDPNSVFIIQVGQDFTTATASSVLLTRGAQACHVYWQIGNSAVFEVGTDFVGTVLAYQDISAKTAAIFEGRLLTTDGAVTLDTNTITLPACAPVVPTPTATTPTPSATTPTPTTTPSTTTPSTTAPSPSATAPATGSTGGDDDGGGGSGSGSPTGSGSGGGSGSSSSTPGLPDTGGPPAALVPVGLLAVAAGAATIAATRRRQRGTHRR